MEISHTEGCSPHISNKIIESFCDGIREIVLDIICDIFFGF